CAVPDPDPNFGAFVDSLPDIYAGTHFKVLVERIVTAHRAGRPVVVALGAHVLKVGLAPLLIDLMRRGVITDVVMNSAGAIHDFEIATTGRTSESVDTQLPAGRFGFADETGKGLAEAAHAGAHPAEGDAPGFGRALGKMLNARDVPFREYSVSAEAARLGVRQTIHACLGADIVHMHPACNGADVGAASMADFQHVCARVADMAGGVWINIGSAVVLPEVFLKAVSVAINLGHDLSSMTTANLDMLRQYRAETNVVRRPPGEGMTIIGQHELLLPLLRQAVLAKLMTTDPEAGAAAGAAASAGGGG
ncbi:MAG: hypothetical protein ACI841_003071, partial [Planctomycetota bacterium]